MNIKKIKRIFPALTILLFLIVYFMGCSATGTYVPGTNVDWVLRWADEFYGPSLNTVHWTRLVVPEGTFNNEFQRYVDGFTNSFITNLGDGMLVIKAIHDGPTTNAGDYSSARLKTEGALDWKYGKIMARIKMPKGGKGIWPAFWMLGANNNEDGYGDVQWPACGEIDIVEMIGSETSSDLTNEKKVYANLFWDDGSEASSLSFTNYTNVLSDNFHIYEIEWDATKIIWRFDNIQYKEENITGADKLEFHQNFFIIINLAVGGNWPKYPTPQTEFPQYMYVDWVRVYQRVIQ